MFPEGVLESVPSLGDAPLLDLLAARVQYLRPMALFGEIHADRRV